MKEKITTAVQTETGEIPVINMQDFQEVDMSDKLNLLMAAINKINTNMHLKLDSLKKVVEDKKEGIVPKVEKLTKNQEELLARVDDMEKT